MILKEIDPLGTDVYNFRKEIITVDENSDISFLETDIKYSKDIPEEVWKFSFRKWNSLDLDSLHGIYIGNELAAISGSKLYGKEKKYLRTGMMYYILKKYRKEIRSPLWIKDGLLDTAIIKFQPRISCSFISIYTHNVKLKKWVDAFSRKERLGQIGIDNHHVHVLKTFKKYPNEIMLHGVLQHIFYRFENSECLSIDNVVDEIRDK